MMTKRIHSVKLDGLISVANAVIVFNEGIYWLLSINQSKVYKVVDI